MLSFVFSEGAAAFGSTFLLDGVSSGGVAGDIISGIANIGSSLINAHTSNKNTKRMIAAQSEENEKAYRRNVEMWERENNYNSPTAVAQRLRDAGFNPALAYGTPNVSAPSPSAPITDMSSMAGMKSPLAGAMEAGVNARYMNALINNIESQSNKNNAEAGQAEANTKTTLTYNDYQEQLIKGQLNEQNARITLNYAETDKADAQSLESYRNCDKILAETRSIYQDIKNKEREYEIMGEELAIKTIQRRYEEPLKRATLKQMFSLANMYDMTAAKTQEEFNQLAAQAEYNLAIKKTESNNEFLRGITMSMEQDMLSIDLDNAEFNNKLKPLDKAFDYTSKLFGMFGQLLQGYGVYRLGDKTRYLKTETEDDYTDFTGHHTTVRQTMYGRRK